jgi:hypothetical protein
MMSTLLALLLLATDPAPRAVERAEVLSAMKAYQGYDVTATTNGARFQAEVLLRLGRQARTERPNGPALLIGHADWFSAFVERAGLTAEKAPTFARLANQHGQDTQIDYRADRVLEGADAIGSGFAANVTIWWPEKSGSPDSYTYEDLLSNPHLKVTNRRSITYRLLDLDGMVVYGRIEGLLGRPTSGFLGALFSVIGEGHLKESRMLISPDGLQISRTHAEKWAFGVTQTVTVYPDGRMEQETPKGRPDLAALAARLAAPLSVRYRP